MSEPLFEVEDLTIKYRTNQGELTAVKDVSFTVQEQEYFGIVGESGCGKSTLARTIIGGLDSNGFVSSGRILYKGEDIISLSTGEFNEKVRWDEISWIPQGAMNSLDPMKKISKQAINLASTHTDQTKAETLDRLRELYDIVGLPESRIHDYPHQYSGGMSQRAIIAFSLLLEPSLIVADEPTTALDVIMQDEIFRYLDTIKEDHDTSMILITHDISLVFESCDRLMVMHGGQNVETGSARDIYHTPHHPYTIMLQEAFPDIRNPKKELGVIEGEPPKQFGEIDHCTYSDRCPLATEECRINAPPREPVDEPGGSDHYVSCFHSDKRDEVMASRPVESAQEGSR